MTDFNSKKEKLAELVEKYIESPESSLNELLDFIKLLKYEDEFKKEELFKNIFYEFENEISELSRKELKQRVLLIRSF